ncbi:MAG: hypothetical protein WC789_07045 [Lentisphaeria bacterium]
MADKTKGAILTGCRARLMIQGVQVGYARGVELSEAIQYDPARVLGNIEVEEHVPLAYDVRFSCSMYRLVGETLKKAGWFPGVGKSTREHLMNVLTSGDLSATLEDVKTGQIVANVEQVKIASHNWSVTSGDAVGEQVEFVAVRIRDETGE